MIATPSNAEMVQKRVFNFEIYRFLKMRPIYPILSYTFNVPNDPYSRHRPSTNERPVFIRLIDGIRSHSNYRTQ